MSSTEVKTEGLEIFAISNGSYSNKEIHCYATSMEEAMAAVKQFQEILTPFGGYEIEKLDTIQKYTEQLKKIAEEKKASEARWAKQKQEDEARYKQWYNKPDN